MQKIRAKRHRLPAAAYMGEVLVAFTACEVCRRQVFAAREIVTVFTECLEQCLAETFCDAPIYCFMPDHLHVMVNGMTVRSRPKTAMELFKQRTGLWLSTNAPMFEWQDDFYDHIIRKSDDWKRQVQYTAFNPVRAGLARDPFDYPHTGSIGYDLRVILAESVL